MRVWILTLGRKFSRGSHESQGPLGGIVIGWRRVRVRPSSRTLGALGAWYLEFSVLVLFCRERKALNNGLPDSNGVIREVNLGVVVAEEWGAQDQLILINV